MDSLIYFLLKLLVCTGISLLIAGLFVFAFSTHLAWGIASLAIVTIFTSAFVSIFIWSQRK